LLQNLSEIVLEEGLATKDDLRRAARASDRGRKPLIEALVRDLELDELVLVKALARHTKTEVADPAHLEVEPEAIRQVAKELCARLKVMPLSVSRPGATQVLRLAVADPTDAVGLAEIEHRCGLGVAPVVAPLSAIEELIQRSYRELITEVMPRNRLPRQTKPDSVATDITPRVKPTTTPHHRIVDEASPELVMQAVVKLLVDKGVLTDDEVDEAVRDLLRERSEEG